jgi:hypothetical protein
LGRGIVRVSLIVQIIAEGRKWRRASISIRKPISLQK